MTRTRTLAKFLSLGLACLICGAMAACDPPQSPSSSPTPEQDPTRHEQARRAEQEARRKSQEAERILLKKRRSPLPVH
jgi:hypothetical protein